MGKTTALITGIVVGVVVGFLIGRQFPTPQACDWNHLIRVTSTTTSLPDTCVSKMAGDVIQWDGPTGSTLVLTIPDPPGGNNPYPTPTCQGSTCRSGTLVPGNIPYDLPIPYSLTVKTQTGSSKPFGHIIIKP